MELKNNIISCDFDGSLSDHFDGEINPYKDEVKDFVKKFIERGYEVYIITRRYGPEKSGKGIGMEHIKPLGVAEELGIPKEKVIFTNREWKYSYIKSIGACMHIDDDETEKYWIDRHLPEVKTIFLGDQDWQNDLIIKIKEHDPLKIWLGNDKNIVKLGIALALMFLALLWLA